MYLCWRPNQTKIFKKSFYYCLCTQTIFSGVTRTMYMQLKSAIYQMELWENRSNLKVDILYIIKTELQKVLKKALLTRVPTSLLFS